MFNSKTEIDYESLPLNKVSSICTRASIVSFSSNGKFLATGGYNNKVELWYADPLKRKSTLEGHSKLILDVRFSPSMPWIATASLDKTVRVWDVDNNRISSLIRTLRSFPENYPSRNLSKSHYSFRTLTGHPKPVVSLDFHPVKDDLICSCDEDGEFRYWSINSGHGSPVFKVLSSVISHLRPVANIGINQVRFQPIHGRFLAVSVVNVCSILDAETQDFRHQILLGHEKHILKVCWNSSGELLASVSMDSVRVWSLREGVCVHKLSSSDDRDFTSCVFHPTNSSWLIVGCNQNLLLWDMAEKKMMMLPGHDDLICNIAESTVTGLVASSSFDKIVKLWK